LAERLVVAGAAVAVAVDVIVAVDLWREAGHDGYAESFDVCQEYVE
jgi:hypothetical protein